MASIRSKIFEFLLRLIKKKKFLELQFSIGKFDFYNAPQPPKEIYRQCDVKTQMLADRKVFKLSPKSGASAKTVLYLHGGAYVQNFVRQHWQFLELLLRKTKCSIIAPDYPLAPKHTFENTLSMLVALYRNILKTRDAKNLIFMGDSAGGGLALALAQKLKEENLPQPKQLILLSPWLDLALDNPGIPLIDPLDPFLGIEGLKKAAKAYAGDTTLTHHLLSPIFGSMEGLGSISLFMGSKDILAADARKLVSAGLSHGIAINYREYQDMFHVWMFMNFPESKRAVVEIIQLVRKG